MKIQYLPGSSVSVLEKELFQLEKNSSINGILILACDSNNYDVNALDKVLLAVKKPLFGGIFPGIIF